MPENLKGGIEPTELDDELGEGINKWLTPLRLVELRNRFSRDGFIMVRDIVPDAVRARTRAEVLDLLDRYAERRDLYLKTTGNTPRLMSVVRSEFIADNGDLVTKLYQAKSLIHALSQIANEPLLPCASKDEEFLITRQEKVGDTHGWHWGDFSFALIWIIDTPELECGGMLQCVPHTTWNKSEPRIHHYLCTNPISTYGFVPGDIYFLRTDTTLHRTVPLNVDATRIILNLTWAARKDLADGPAGDDRWWEDSTVSAATKYQG